MKTTPVERIEARLNDILSRAEAGDMDALDRLPALVEVRRLAGGRFIFVPRGAPRQLRDIPHDQIISSKPILDVKRAAKLRRYRDKKNDSTYKGSRIIAEGDSWFEYPCAKDMIDWLGERFAVLSLARAGDKWIDIKNQETQTYSDGTSSGLFRNIRDEQPNIVLLSVGGNEVLGEIETYVDHFVPHHPDRPGADYILPGFEKLLDDVEDDYRQYIGQIVPHAHVIVHSYDYPDVRSQTNGGQWIGGPLENERRIPFGSVWCEIAGTMLDRFCRRIELVIGEFSGRAHFVQQLGTIGTRTYSSEPNQPLWQDELHPTKAGSAIMFKAIAAKIDEVSLLA